MTKTGLGEFELDSTLPIPIHIQAALKEAILDGWVEEGIAPCSAITLDD